MTHYRKQIREKVKDILVAATTSAGDRIFSNLPLHSFAETYPLIRVWILEESSDELDMSGGKYRRSLQLIIEGRVRSTSDQLDDELDQLAIEIETAMKADHTLGGLVAKSSLVRTEVALSAEGSPPPALIGLQYEVIYTF